MHKNTDWKEADNSGNSGYSTEKDESGVGLFLYSSLHFLHFSKLNAHYFENGCGVEAIKWNEN